MMLLRFEKLRLFAFERFEEPIFNYLFSCKCKFYKIECCLCYLRSSLGNHHAVFVFRNILMEINLDIIEFI